MSRRFLQFILALTITLLLVPFSAAAIKVKPISHSKEIKLNALGKTVSNLVEIYHPQLEILLNGHLSDKVQEVKIVFLNDFKKPLPTLLKRKGSTLFLSTKHFKQLIANDITGSLWLENFPNEAGDILTAVTEMILHANKKSPDWATDAIKNYVRFNYSFQKKGSKPNKGGNLLSSSVNTAGFLKYIKQNYDNNIIIKMTKAVRRGNVSKSFFKFACNKPYEDLWGKYQNWLKNSKRLKYLWYPVNVKYENCPDLEYFAIKCKLICEIYYSTLIQQLDSPGFKPYESITLEFKKMAEVAATGGSYIAYSADFYRKNNNDYGSVVHELTHVVQKSPAYDPVWIIESTADYFRYFHGYRANRKESTGGNFTNGYQRGADFFKYIVSIHNLPNFVKDLNKQVRNKKFYVPNDQNSNESQNITKSKQLKKIDTFFIKSTAIEGSRKNKIKPQKGKTVQELWDEFQLWLKQPTRPILWENQGLNAIAVPEAISQSKSTIK